MAMLDNEGFEGKYNFLYLPIDFQSRACLGYASLGSKKTKGRFRTENNLGGEMFL